MSKLPLVTELKTSFFLDLNNKYLTLTNNKTGKKLTYNQILDGYLIKLKIQLLVQTKLDRKYFEISK